MNLTELMNINDVSVLITEPNINKLRDSTSTNYPKEASSLLFGEVLAENTLVKEVFNVPNFSSTVIFCLFNDFNNSSDYGLNKIKSSRLKGREL